MFYLYHSNDLDVLSGILVKLMTDIPLEDPFQQESILVQSQGMAHWLKLKLADNLGIAANLDFPLPSSFIWQVFNQLQPSLPERSPFDKQIMAWKLIRLLPELVEMEHCHAIRQYLTANENGRKTYQLAHKIADVFDQYLVYRPDWLLAWEEGKDDVDGAHVQQHPWQPHVWRALIADTQKLGQSTDHRARLVSQLDTLIQQHPERLHTLPDRLFVFGIAALPGSYWQVLNAISANIDVHFFLLNPCRNFWGDVSSNKQRLAMLQRPDHTADHWYRGNPLLASWGKLGKDFLTLLYETNIQDVEAYVEPLPEKSDDASLLTRIKSDILNLYDRQSRAFTPAALENSLFKQVIAEQDNSIQLISAHNPLREVQNLHDQLLHWFNQHPELNPRDIVVMVPDIDQYASYIDAVFSSVEPAHRIPWAIADQSMAQEDPVISAFLSLLALPDSRLLVTDVQDWLEVDAIRKRFDIEEQDLPDIKYWLQKADIRWGLNAQHRASLNLPAFEQNSWQKGLQQLLLGFVLPDDTTSDWEGDWPVSAVEGHQAELLGKLMHFVDSIACCQAILSQPQTVSSWTHNLLSLLDDMFTDEENNTASLQPIRESISHWVNITTYAAFDQSLSPQVMRDWFTENLNQQGGWQRFLSGPVNICTLMPMRSIPFKVICMLGMNDTDYPRQVIPVGFDLMTVGKSRRGDRSRRDDDRYLFLEAVCSAQQYLYISYRGRDSRENTEQQPSVLVSELMDYIADGFCLEKDRLLPHMESKEKTIRHLLKELPLQPFNLQYFHPDQQQSFNQIWADVASSVNTDDVISDSSKWSTSLPLPNDLDRQHVQWQDVKQAVSRPLQFFMRRRLKVSLDIAWQSHQTEEPFHLDGLSHYQLSEEYLHQYLWSDKSSQDMSSDFYKQQQAKGHLPVNSAGHFYSEDITQAIQPLAQILKETCTRVDEIQPLLLELDRQQGQTLNISGELRTFSNGEFVYYRSGQFKGTHFLNAWMDIVFASACGRALSDSAMIYAVDRKKQSIMQYEMAIPRQIESREYIQNCVRLYWEIWSKPVPMMVNTLWELQQLEINSPQLKEEPEQHFIKQKTILNKLLAQENSELNSPYLERCLPEFIPTLFDYPALNNWINDYSWMLEPIVHSLSEVSTTQVDQKNSANQRGAINAAS